MPPLASWSKSRTASKPWQDGRVYIERVNEPFRLAAVGPVPRRDRPRHCAGVATTI